MVDFVINNLARFLYIIRFLKKHNKTRKGLFWSFVALFGVYIFVGADAIFTIFDVVGRFGIFALIAIVQFGLLLYFLSLLKMITILPGENTLSLDDYGGQPALIENMRQWLKIFQGDKVFKEMGGKVPRGMLLTGDFGAGKTFLAKCLSGSSGTVFNYARGSEFNGPFVGIDFLKMTRFNATNRDLAYKYGFCFAVIDELHALGGNNNNQQQAQGGQGMFGGSSLALPTLLTEMSGIEEENEYLVCLNIVRKIFRLPAVEKGNIFWIGITNKSEDIAPALLRDGRMTIKFHIDKPDELGRKNLIELFLKRITHSQIDSSLLASYTHGITPAALETAITEYAPRIARFKNRDTVSEKDIQLSILEQQTGVLNPIGDIPLEQHRQIAIHESGHAVALYHLRKNRKVWFLSILRRVPGTLGFMLPVDSEASYALPIKDIISNAMIAMAGDAATEIILGERWTGAGGDIEQIRNFAHGLATHGYFEGLIMNEDNIPPKMLEKIQTWYNKLWVETKTFCQEHKKEIVELSSNLLEKGEINGEDVVLIIEKAIQKEKEDLE